MAGWAKQHNDDLERSVRQGIMVVTLSGRMKAEELAELKALLDADYRTIVLDLRDVRLADRDTVKFLRDCEPCPSQHFHTVHSSGYKLLPEVSIFNFARGDSKEMPVSKPVAFLAAIFFARSVPIGHTQSPRRVEIIAERFTYEPDTITANKGEPIVLVLHRSDGNRAGGRVV